MVSIYWHIEYKVVVLDMEYEDSIVMLYSIKSAPYSVIEACF